jgi:glycosyltransferase involved in cell wall biosynthesis
MNLPDVDLQYLAYNRLEFTRESFEALLRHTDWHLVRELVVHDDGSEDGTREWLESAIATVPVRARMVETAFSSPITAMNHFIEAATAPLVAKIDNDTVVPPGWLAQAVGVMRRHPELDLLGLEAMRPHQLRVARGRTYVPASCVSGLGIYRRAIFSASRPQVLDRWHGFEEWQVGERPPRRAGWMDPALPLVLLDRCPFEPWRTLTHKYVRRGWQRAWPAYDPRSTLWRWRWPGDPGARLEMQGYPGFVGALRVKNEAPHITEVIRRALTLCQHVLVFDDHSDDATLKLCRAFGERVTVLESPFAGLDEARDKNYLLERVCELAPDWVLWIDGDELLERSGAEQLNAAAVNADADVAAMSLRVAYAWDDADRIRVDGIYGGFARPSLFRLAGQPVAGLRFPATRQGGNFHCGNVPQGLIGTMIAVDVRLKHLGYLTAAQRHAKYEWYTSIDPDNPAEDNYRHLIDLPGARFVSGPPETIPWVE